MRKIIIWSLIIFFNVLVAGIIWGSLVTTNKLETISHEINDNFEDVKIVTDTADIMFVISDESNSLVVCDEQKNTNHLVKVKDNTLLIEFADNRKWYEHIGINFSTPKITIYLPKKEYGKLSIKTSTGNINTESIIANTIDFSTSTGHVDVIGVNCHSDIKINVSTGNINIVNANCKNFISSGSTGNISLNNVISIEKFSIKRSTGNVKFKKCDASDISVKTDTGDVTGSLLTDKVFFAQTDTGSIDVPKIMADEKCEVITDTGDIKITIGIKD